MSNQNLVSVVMPNINGAPFIGKAIMSVLEQSWNNWELVIIDDASSDSSRDIIQKFAKKDKRIKPIFLQQRMGLPGLVRNFGIGKAQGRFLAFLDSDDIWSPEKLTSQISYMMDNDAVLCTTHTRIIDLKGDMTGAYEPQMKLADWNLMLKENVVSTSAMIIDRDKGLEVEFSDYKYFEDYACWMKLIKSGYNVFIFPEKLTSYRINPSFYILRKMNKFYFRYRIYREYFDLSVYVACKNFIFYFCKGIKKSFGYKAHRC